MTIELADPKLDKKVPYPLPFIVTNNFSLLLILLDSDCPRMTTDLVTRSLSHSLLLGLSCLLSLLVISLVSVTRSRLGNNESTGCGLLTKPEDTAEEQINEDEFIYISKKCDNTMM